MVEEAYVSFEVAKLLAEKGFKEATLWYTYGEGLNNHYSKPRIILPSDIEAGRYPLPTQQMAMRYLREYYGINLKAEEKCFCETSHDEMRVKKVYYHWCPEIQLLHNTKIHEGLVPINQRMEINADSYENAIDKGVEWILENLL